MTIITKKNNEEFKLIEFFPWDETIFQTTASPMPAKGNIPDYYKKFPRYHNGDEPQMGSNLKAKSGANSSLKHCMPYLDAMTGGYHYPLWCDLYVKNVRGIPQINWRPDLPPLFEREVEHLPTPVGHYNAHFAWHMWWGLKTPPGYSSLITHPLNRPDLPFTSVSGIMDTDKYTSPGNVSFHIKQDFEGIIPAGTPFIQVIPIKRDNWKSEINKDLQQEAKWSQERKKTLLSGYYKKNLWQSKDYS